MQYNGIDQNPYKVGVFDKLWKMHLAAYFGFSKSGTSLFEIFFSPALDVVSYAWLREVIPKKICFDLDIVQRGGGLTRIQIVRGTIKKNALFSEKFLVGIQEPRGGVKVQIEADFFLG